MFGGDRPSDGDFGLVIAILTRRRRMVSRVRCMVTRSMFAVGLVLVSVGIPACGGSTTSTRSTTEPSGTVNVKTNTTQPLTLKPPTASHTGAEVERVVKALNAFCRQGEVAVVNRTTRSVRCARPSH